GGQGAPVKGAFERDQAIALRRAVHEMMASGHLDGTLDRLGARIAEEHRIGEGGLDEAPRKPLLAGHPVQIGRMPETVRLVDECLDQTRMAVTQIVDRNAGAEIEIAVTGGRVDG